MVNLYGDAPKDAGQGTGGIVAYRSHTEDSVRSAMRLPVTTAWAGFHSNVGEHTRGVATGIGGVFAAVFRGESVTSGFYHGAASSAAEVKRIIDEDIAEAKAEAEAALDRADAAIGDAAESSVKAGEAIAKSGEALEAAAGAVSHADGLNEQRIAAEKVISANVASALEAAGRAQVSADGRSTNFYGSVEPVGAREGDVWFKKDTAGKTTIFQRVKDASGQLVWQAGYNQASVDSAIAAKVSTSDYTAKMKALDSSLSSQAQDLARKINKGEVQASDLVANAVVAGKINADAVTGRELKAGSIASNHVAARSINASHLVIAQPGNLIANGDFSSGVEPWTGAITSVASGGGTPNGKYGNLVTGYRAGDFHGTDNWFMVEPGASYAFECWLYADTPGSVFFMQCKNQDGILAGKTMNVVVNEGDSLSAGGNSNYLVNGVVVPANKWTRFSCVYQMGPKTTKARIATIWFNHGNGVQTGKQAIGGVSLRPMADASLIVDGGILARHVKAGEIGTNQLAANAVKTVNLDAEAVTADKIAVNSLTAREIKAEMFTQVGTNVLPLIPGTTTGAWTHGHIATGLDKTIGVGEAGRYYTFGGYVETIYENLVAVDPTVEYDFSVWVKGEGAAFVVLVDQDGHLAIESGGINNAAATVSPDSDGVVTQTGEFLVELRQAPTEWTHYRSRVRLKPGVRFIRCVGCDSSASDKRLHIADMQLRVHIVPQAEIDAAQNATLELHNQLFEQQNQINEMLVRTDEAQNNALDAISFATRSLEKQQTQFAVLNMYDKTSSNPDFAYTPTSATFAATGTWTGTGGYIKETDESPAIGSFTIPAADGTRNLPRISKGIVFYTKADASVETATVSASTGLLLPNDSWTVISGVEWVVPQDTAVWPRLDVLWAEAYWAASYNLDITVNGKAISVYAPDTWVGSSPGVVGKPLWQATKYDTLELKAGDRIGAIAKSKFNVDVNRRISEAKLTVKYLKDG